MVVPCKSHFGKYYPRHKLVRRSYSLRVPHPRGQLAWRQRHQRLPPRRCLPQCLPLYLCPPRGETDTPAKICIQFIRVEATQRILHPGKETKMTQFLPHFSFLSRASPEAKVSGGLRSLANLCSSTEVRHAFRLVLRSPTRQEEMHSSSFPPSSKKLTTTMPDIFKTVTFGHFLESKKFF